jgi:hypothetical protein
MQKARTLALLLVSIACISPANSQGMMEGTFVRGLGAGMGAGTAAGMGHGKVVRRTAESLIQAQQAMIAQTKTIEQYVASGIQLQAKKQWTTAEQYFQEALKVIAKRDGPGSPKSAPVLARLATVAKNQHKLDEAIGYQKTVVAFANNAKAQNPTAAVQAQVELSNLFIDKGDLHNAEGTLKQSADIVRSDRSIPPKTYSTTLRVYGEVLRKLNKNSEADAIDAEIASKGGESTTAASVANVTTPQPAATTTPPAVSADGTAVSTAPPETAVPAASSSASASAAAASAAPEGTASAAQSANSSAASLTSATDAASATSSGGETVPAAATNPPGALLPPPTADWPVMSSDGKIVSEPADASSQTTTAPATAPTVAPSAGAAPASAPVAESNAQPPGAASATPATASTGNPEPGASSSAQSDSGVAPANAAASESSEGK